MSGKHAGRSGAVWARLRAEVLAGADTCTACGTWISDDLPPAHPHKATADHIVGLDVRPDLAHDRSNLRPVCWSCNSRRGARYANAKRLRREQAERGEPGPSRRW